MRYEVCLAKSSPDNCSDIDFHPVDITTSYSFTQENIAYRGKYFIVLKAVNNAGLISLQVSKAFEVDTSAPQPGSTFQSNYCSEFEQGNSCVESSLRITHISNILLSCFDDLITASWKRYHDKQSGIAKVDWCIGSLNTTCDIRNWESISVNLTSLSSIIPSLVNFTEIYVRIRFTNNLGQATTITSNPCVPRKGHPPIVKVKEIKNPNSTDDIDFQRDLTSLIVAWDKSYDVKSHRVEVAVTDTSINVAKSLKFVNVSSEKNQVIFVNLTLKGFVKYYSVVRIWNEFGLYSDSYSNGVITVPDHPFLIDVTITENSLSYDNRWKQYFNNSNFFTENYNSQISQLAHPLNMLLNLSGTYNIEEDTEPERTFQEAPCLFKLSIERVTAAEYEQLENATTVSHTIFDQTHVYDSDHTCCMERNPSPKTIFPDKELKPVGRPTNFGLAIATLGNNSLIAIVSQNGVHIFPSKNYDNTLPLHFMEFDEGIDFASIILKGKDDRLLISVSGKVLLYDIVLKSPATSTLAVVINHCAVIKTSEESNCSESETWSSEETVGNSVAYDFNKTIAVGGFDNKQHSGVVAIFEKQNNWYMRQVLRVEVIDPMFGRVTTINKNVLVVLGGQTNPITFYKRMSNQYQWGKDENISESLKVMNPNATNVHLTDENELIFISNTNHYLHVIQFNPKKSFVELKCRYSFSKHVNLSGSIGVTRTKSTVIAIGCKVDYSDGAILISYGTDAICHELGTVIIKPGHRFDRSKATASIGLLEDQVIIGVPDLPIWKEDGEYSGTGLVFLATFCSSNSIRSKRLEFGRTYVNCHRCENQGRAYPGFDEQCVNCTNVICANQTYIELNMAKIDHKSLAVVQNVSSNNLTVMETTQISGKFYQPDTKHSYFAQLTQVSAAGFKSSRVSTPVWFDKTSPEPGQVYDGSSSYPNCSGNFSMGSRHQCSSHDFSESDIDFTSNLTTINARWFGFRDNETSIQSYHWCIGSNPLSDDIMECVNATSHATGSFSGLSLSHGSIYYVTVVACNQVKLCTASSSDGVMVDLTPPILDSVNDGLFGEDIDMQVS